jgi:hypothetical protein
MNNKLKIFLVGSLIFASGFAVAQTPAARSWATTVATAAFSGEKGDDEKLARAYQSAAGNADLTKMAAQLAFSWEENAKPTETSLAVLQVMQNQKIIEQNAQIIKLLSRKK